MLLSFISRKNGILAFIRILCRTYKAKTIPA